MQMDALLYLPVPALRGSLTLMFKMKELHGSPTHSQHTGTSSTESET